MALRLEGGQRFLVLIHRGGHHLVFHPLVADELETVIRGVLGQEFVGRVDKAGRENVLLLERGVSQCGIDGVLGQALRGAPVQGGVQILACDLHRRTDILEHRLRRVDILQDGLESGDFSGHFVRHLREGVELVGAGLHDQIRHDEAVLVLFVVQEQLLHIVGHTVRNLPGKLGRLGDIAADLAFIGVPIQELRGHNTQYAHAGQHCQHGIKALLAFHGIQYLTNTQSTNVVKRN